MSDPRFIPAPRLARIDAPASPRRAAGVLTAAAAVMAMVLATAMPVRALDRDDLAKALIAAIVIGAIVKESKRKSAPAPVPVPTPAPVSKRIPRVCAIEVEGRTRVVTVYPERCLREQGVRAKLPVHCAQEARIYGAWDRIYGEKCLNENGFILTSGRIH